MSPEKLVREFIIDTGAQLSALQGFELVKRIEDFAEVYKSGKEKRYNRRIKRIIDELPPKGFQENGIPKKIIIIKELREATGLGLRECKDIVDLYFEEEGLL